MTAMMQALQMVAWQQPPQLRSVPVPEPGPGQVLVKIAGAGLCHSDLHVMEVPAELAPFPLPFTLGHESAGWVEKLGPGAHGVAVGDAVIVYGPWGCGYCINCLQGMDNYCQTEGFAGTACGLGRDGGMAPYMLVPSVRNLVPLGDLDPREAGPLTDAALTTYHAIKRSLHLLGAGTTAVVIGVGGLGQMAVQILKALSSATTVIAVDTAESKLATARELGADIAVVSGEDAVAAVRTATGGQGAQLVLDIVGIDSTLQMAAQMGRTLGHITIVGIGGGTMPVSFYTVPHECSVTSPYWGSIPELLEVIALARAGKITLRVERFALADALVGYDRLHHGQIAGRAVVTPNG
jgi:propanol-preferring alcohol dehydrogenase